MRKLVAGVFAAALTLVPAGASAHTGVDCRNQSSCLEHCVQFHRGVDRAVCLVTHNVLN